MHLGYVRGVANHCLLNLMARREDHGNIAPVVKCLEGETETASGELRNKHFLCEGSQKEIQ